MAHDPKYKVDYDIVEKAHVNQTGEPYYPGLNTKKGKKWFNHRRAFQAMIAKIANAKKLKDELTALGKTAEAAAVVIPPFDARLAKLVMPIRYGHLRTVKKYRVTFRPDQHSELNGATDPVVVELEETVEGAGVSLATLSIPAVTIKAGSAATRERDADKWSCQGAATGVKTEAEIKGLTINKNLTITVVTKGK